MQITIQHSSGSATPVWVTWISDSEAQQWNRDEGLGGYDGDDRYTEGFYWAVCFPGCIPDSEFSGPFDSEELAEQNATEFLTECDE